MYAVVLKKHIDLERVENGVEKGNEKLVFTEITLKWCRN